MMVITCTSKTRKVLKCLVVLLATCLLVFFVAGCSKQVTGTPSQVVEECQGIPTNESVEVTVTGYIAFMGHPKVYGDSIIIDLANSDTMDDMYPQVVCSFDGTSEQLMETLDKSYRMTVAGRVFNVGSNTVWLEDCSLK